MCCTSIGRLMDTCDRIWTRVRIPAYTGQDESGSCQNVYMELHDAPHRWHMKSEDRYALLAKISLEAEWASSRLAEVARSSVQLSI
jgi:hypothetical protein